MHASLCDNLSTPDALEALDGVVSAAHTYLKAPRARSRHAMAWPARDTPWPASDMPWPAAASLPLCQTYHGLPLPLSRCVRHSMA